MPYISKYTFTKQYDDDFNRLKESLEELFSNCGENPNGVLLCDALEMEDCADWFAVNDKYFYIKDHDFEDDKIVITLFEQYNRKSNLMNTIAEDYSCGYEEEFEETDN